MPGLICDDAAKPVVRRSERSDRESMTRERRKSKSVRWDEQDLFTWLYRRFLVAAAILLIGYLCFFLSGLEVCVEKVPLHYFRTNLTSEGDAG